MWSRANDLLGVPTDFSDFSRRLHDLHPIASRARSVNVGQTVNLSPLIQAVSQIWGLRVRWDYGLVTRRPAGRWFALGIGVERGQ
jgi:hypothetical protein